MAARHGDGMDQPETGVSLSPTAKLSVGVVATSLMLWFLFAWLVLDQHVLDAAGESVGTAFVLGMLVSLVGALRGPR